MTQTFTLVFPSLNSLYGFVREFRVNYIDKYDDTYTLTCNCGDEDVEVAKKKYGATLASS